MKLTNLLRCILFDILFYLVTVLITFLGAPSLLTYRSARLVSDFYINVVMFLVRNVLGIYCNFQPMPPKSNGRGRLLAVKHQSAWETLALRYYYPDAVGVAKQTLFWSPFGWYLRRLGFISINRSGGSKALQGMMRGVQQQLDKGVDVILYPEGTRRAVDAPPVYKSGIYGLYRYCRAEVRPIAHNSGYCWGKRALRRCPGEIGMVECAPIAEGLGKEEFMTLLEERIEGACAVLNQS